MTYSDDVKLNPLAAADAFARRDDPMTPDETKVLLERLQGLAERWERIADEKGVTTFTGNGHRLFANELRAALTPADEREIG